MTFAKSPARRGLDWLLELNPHLELLSIEWQIDPSDGRSVARWAGPWILVELGQPSENVELEPVFARHRFAIWRATGAVHGMDGGAVTDDPLFEPWP